MNQISVSYSFFDKGGRIIDYAKFSSEIGESFKRFVNISVTGLKITKNNILF